MVAAELSEARAASALVLVVEDEVLIRMLLSDELRQAGFAVIEAANGDEALEVLAAQVAPDVMITDVRMPGGIDGLGLAAQARRAHPRLRVIVTSGHCPLGAAEIADAFIPKPYDLGRLVQHVRAMTPPA